VFALPVSDEYFTEFYIVEGNLCVKVHVDVYEPSGLGMDDLVERDIYNSFDTYVHVRPVVPWSSSTVMLWIRRASKDEKAKEPSLIGRVAHSQVLRQNIEFRQVGNAQAWLSKGGHCALWECFLFRGFKLGEDGVPSTMPLFGGKEFDWKTLEKLWLWFENYLKTKFKVHTFFTHDGDALFEGTPDEEKYREFLKSLGYQYKPIAGNWRFKRMMKRVSGRELGKTDYFLGVKFG
jgi:hypothetical protein